MRRGHGPADALQLRGTGEHRLRRDGHDRSTCRLYHGDRRQEAGETPHSGAPWRPGSQFRQQIDTGEARLEARTTALHRSGDDVRMDRKPGSGKDRKEFVSAGRGMTSVAPAAWLDLDDAVFGENYDRVPFGFSCNLHRLTLFENET